MLLGSFSEKKKCIVLNSLRADTLNLVTQLIPKLETKTNWLILCYVMCLGFMDPLHNTITQKNTLLHDKQCRRTRKTEIIFSKQISKSSQGYTASFANQQRVFFTRCHVKGPFHNIMLFNFLVLCFQDIIST